MSTTVDQRVVEMRFDNKQFESGVSTTMSTLEKLKKSLRLDGAAKGLEQVNETSKRCDMSALGGAIEAVQAKFSALQVIGITALMNITNQAVNAGQRIVSALTIDPIKTGFQEYETQINAVQTILANTESKGSTLKDVNQALDELNVYADKTIYNFTEMTRNIGTFTAAGVDLKTSTSAIQGIANLAAVSGSTSQQASTAMYQLSQALSSGTVKLQDWNSVVNAGMGGQVFQDALKKTAKAHGVAVDEMIEKNGSFRESLQEGWITSEILTETLGKMTQSGAAEYLSDLTGVSQKQIEAAQKAVDVNKDGSASYDEIAEKMAKTGKVSKDEALEILKMADTATNAATKVKTFTQLWDTLQEAAQSGWTQSWEIIVGDFEEAKELLTNISDVVGDIINKSAEARNKVLQGWKDLGGRNDLIASFKNVFEAITSIIKPIKEAFKDVFPPVTAKTLYNITAALKNFTSHLIIGEKTADKIKRTFQGVFSILDMFRKGILLVASAISSFLGGGAVSGVLDLFLSITAAIGDFFTSVNKGFVIDGFTNVLSKISGGLSKLIGDITSGSGKIGSVLSSIGNFLGDAFGKIWNSIKDVFTWITDNVSLGDILAGVVGGTAFVTLKNIIDLVSSAKDLFDGGIMGILFGKGDDNPKEAAKGFKESFSDILGSVNETLQSFTTGIKIGSVVAIAAAIGILAHALKTISQLDGASIVESLGAVGALMAMLSFELKALTKTLNAFESKGIVKTAIALILVAEAVKILADALVKIGSLSLGEVGKGLVGIAGSLGTLAGALKIINKVKVPMRTSLAILVLAESCKVLASALTKFGEMQWDEIARGLTAMGGALLELVGTIAILGKVGGFKSLIGSASLLIAVHALDEMAEALIKFGSTSWDEIKRGLTAMGGALAELVISLAVLGKIGGFSSILASGAILIVSKSLDDISETLIKFGSMSWDEIKRGLTAMGGALAELVIALIALGKIGGFSSIIASEAILIVSKSLDDISETLIKLSVLSWDAVKRSLTAMGGALAELVIALTALGKIGGFSSLFAAGSILIVVQGLGEMADALIKFGFMSWDEIKRGLVGMGGALAEVAVACGALGKIAGFSSLIGSGSILITVQGLGDLAEAFKVFGSMSWDEIKRGLVGMGGALTEVAVVAGALGALAGLPALLGGGAILLAVQDLGKLADALKKFGEMQWDEIGRGLTAMGGALGEIALGSLANALSGLGASAIAEVAAPLGDLADSIKKWEDVSVPEGLGRQLTSLGDGVYGFTLSGFGADAIAAVAKPLGDLADSVRKWTDVTVPEGLGSQLSELGNGIEAFTFGGFGADAIASVAEPLGSLSDSVTKWANVTVPEGLEQQLLSLARGVEAFTLAGFGADTISNVAEPLGTLAGSIAKWSDIEVPESIGDDLAKLASGVSAFGSSLSSIVGGWSLDTTANSLNVLADAIKKISTTKIPKDIDKQLQDFSDAATSLAKNLKSVALVDITGITSMSSAVEKMSGAIKKASGTDVSGVDDFVKAVNKFGKIKDNSEVLTSAATSISTAVTKIVNSINNTLKGGKESISSSMSTALSGMTTAIKSSTGSVKSETIKLVDAVIEAINTKKSAVTSAFKGLVTDASSAIRSNYSDMSLAGGYLGDGLIVGINSKKQSVYDAAYKLGQKAVQGEKDGQKSKSPSRATRQAGKWLGEGLIIGMQEMGQKVYSSGKSMGENAVDSLSKTLNSMSLLSESDVDLQPTIRPVLDLSDVQSGSNAIGSMFSTATVGVSANIASINSMMNQNNQNGVNDDIINAINKLNNSLNNLERPSYNINGVTYDDGSNISSAVEALVRAARIERRV